MGDDSDIILVDLFPVSVKFLINYLGVLFGFLHDLDWTLLVCQ